MDRLVARTLFLCMVCFCCGVVAAGQYKANLFPWPTVIDKSPASGFASLVVFENQTATIDVYVYNVTQLNQAHIHVTARSGGDPILIWLLPAATTPDAQSPLGVGTHSIVPPLTGSLKWTATFNASSIQQIRGINITTWAQFVSYLDATNLLYINVHTVVDSDGFLRGNLIPGNLSYSDLPAWPDQPQLQSPTTDDSNITGVYVISYGGPIGGYSHARELAAVPTPDFQVGFALTTYSNETAHASIQLSNVDRLIQTHIHYITDATNGNGPVIVSLMPTTLGNDSLGVLGVYPSDMPPLSGAFSWDVHFDITQLHSYPPKVNLTTWDQLLTALGTPSTLYVAVHTVDYPDGYVIGFVSSIFQSVPSPPPPSSTPGSSPLPPGGPPPSLPGPTFPSPPPPPPPNANNPLLGVRDELLIYNPSFSKLWSGDQPCGQSPWQGVQCNSKGQVTNIELQFKSLVGPLPQSLQSITSLTSLDLSHNSFNGSLPTAYSALTQLTGLYITDNDLLGTLPHAWSTLSDLQILDLRNEQLSSSIPNSWPAGMKAIQQLWFSGNTRMCGTIPTSFLDNNMVFYDNTGLNQTCPTTNALLALRNAVNASTWPSNFVGWNESTDPCGGGWTGVSCDALGRIAYLELQYQRRMMGTIPPELGQLTDLVTLRLANNPRLSGILPDAWSSLVKLQTLDLSGDHISGSIPAAWTSLTDLDLLNLAGNQLSSSIPSAYSQLSALTKIVITGNSHMCGPLPYGFDNGTRVERDSSYAVNCTVTPPPKPLAPPPPVVTDPPFVSSPPPSTRKLLPPPISPPTAPPPATPKLLPPPDGSGIILCTIRLYKISNGPETLPHLTANINNTYPDGPGWANWWSDLSYQNYDKAIRSFRLNCTCAGTSNCYTFGQDVRVMFWSDPFSDYNVKTTDSTTYSLQQSDCTSSACNLYQSDMGDFDNQASSAAISIGWTDFSPKDGQSSPSQTMSVEGSSMQRIADM